MDPLTAFGLLCNVIQVVDFSLKTISSCREIALRGSTNKLIDTEYVATHVKELNDDLNAHLASAVALAPLSRPDQQLKALAEQCRQAANDFIKEVAKIKINPADAKNKFKVFCKAVEVRWKTGGLQDIQQKMEALRRTLDTRLLARLSQAYDLQALQLRQEFKALNSVSQKIIENLASGQRTMIGLIETRLAEEHDRTRKENSNNSVVVRQHIDDVASQFRNLTISDKQRSDILASLSFPMMNARQAAIVDHNKDTFEWIFKSRDESDFTEWLQEGSGTYWINGKPGSGKSTLMSFVFAERRTRKSLHEWSKNNKLTLASSYLWCSGSPEQRNLSGLLRSLVYQCVQQSQPDALPALLALLKAEVTNNTPMADDVVDPIWNIQNLTMALRHFINHSHQMRFCFFIDGLDEFDGPYQDLLKIISDLAKFPTVKLCVSSRPIYDFVKAFKSCPNLQLQDLTYEDMVIFVRDRLSQHPAIEDMPEKDAFHLKNLIKDIADKAEGVFLWVVLAVQELLQGLEYLDSIEELQRRLDSLPEGLNEMYTRMWNNIDKIYRDKAKFFLQIMLANNDRFVAPSILLFILAENEYYFNSLCCKDYTEAIRSWYSAPNGILMTQGRQMEVYLRTRCAGMLQIDQSSKKKGSFTDLESDQSQVSFVHRTMRDFLIEADNENQLFHTTELQRKETLLAYVKSLIVLRAIYEFENCTMKHSCHINPYKHIAFSFMIMDHVRLARNISPQFQHDMLSVVIQAVQYHTKCDHRPRPLKRSNINDQSNALSLAAWGGCFDYVVDNWESSKELARRNPELQLLACAVDGFYDCKDRTLDEKFYEGKKNPSANILVVRGDLLRLIQKCLITGTDPNTAYDHFTGKQYEIDRGSPIATIWSHFFYLFTRLLAEDHSGNLHEPRLGELVHTIEVFLQNGANVNQSTHLPDPIAYQHEYLPDRVWYSCFCSPLSLIRDKKGRVGKGIVQTLENILLSYSAKDLQQYQLVSIAEMDRILIHPWNGMDINQVRDDSDTLLARTGSENDQRINIGVPDITTQVTILGERPKFSIGNPRMYSDYYKRWGIDNRYWGRPLR